MSIATIQSQYELIKTWLANRINTTLEDNIFDKNYIDTVVNKLWPDTTPNTYQHHVSILYALFQITKYTYIPLQHRDKLKHLESSYKKLLSTKNFHTEVDTAMYNEGILYEYTEDEHTRQNKINFVSLENSLNIPNILMYKGLQNVITLLPFENNTHSIVQNRFLTHLYYQVFCSAKTQSCKFKDNNEIDTYLSWLSEHNSMTLIHLLFNAMEKFKFQVKFENKDDMHVKQVIEILKRHVPELTNAESTIHAGIGLGFDLLQIADMLKASTQQIDNIKLPTMIFNTV